MSLLYPFGFGVDLDDSDFWPVLSGGQQQQQQRGRNARPQQQQRQGPTLLRPKMDWIEQEEKNIVTFELPGLAKKDVDLTLHDNVLTISGNVTTYKETKEDASHLVCERRYGAFSRALAVPAGLKEGEIKATMEDGLLKLEFPKHAKETETKRIAIA